MLPAAKEKMLVSFAPMVSSAEEIFSLAAARVEGKTETLSKTRVWGFGEKILPVIRATWQLSENTRWGCENSSWKTVVGSALDANGNTLTDASGKSFTWDFENRLTQAVVPGTNGGTTTFRYDPFGRRIQKSGPLGTTNYLYDGPNAIEEVDNSGNVLARYTQGKSIDEPLAQLRPGTTSYYQQDGLGSVTSLSNSAGVLAETYGYDSYGKTTTSTGTLTNPFQYTGRELDSETGIYYYRARYFDPGPGRFLSEDRLRFQQGPNFYRYAQNNSLRWVDPTGNGQTCWSVTPNGMTQVPCSGDCIQTGSNSWSCSVTPTGPPPPPSVSELDEALNLLDQIDKCEREKREEIYELETEATNSSVSDLPWIPGKSLAAQVAEEVGLKIPYLDLGFFGWDIFWLGWDYNEFEQQLNNIQQSECGCKKRAK
jgi:RHS repeat-associated protein